MARHMHLPQDAPFKSWKDAQKVMEDLIRDFATDAIEQRPGISLGVRLAEFLFRLRATAEKKK